MTGIKRGWCQAALLGMIAVLCWTLALAAAVRLTEQYEGLSVRFDAPFVTQKDLERVANEAPDGEIACIAAWTSETKRKTATSEMGEQALLRVIRAYGDLRQVAPMNLLAGSFPLGDDSGGCLIDEASAWKLFHANDAIGAKVFLDGKTYLVRGVVQSYEPMLLLRGAAATYENLEFSARDLSSAKQPAETFLYRCNAAGAYVFVQSGLLARIALGAVWFCVCLFGAAGAIALFRSAWGRRANLRCALPRGLAGAALAAVAIVLLAKTMYWPQSFLPTKWSDFHFWSSLVESGKTQWKAISLLTPFPKEIQLLSGLRRCGVLLLTALLSGGWCAASLFSAHSTKR